MEEVEQTLMKFLQTLEKATSERALKHQELQKFWQNSFQSYMGKMKFPKKIDQHPRRYFHLHAMMYVLQKTNPRIVWNLCVGNSKPTIPVLEKFVELSQTATKTCYWINIDIVPELKQYNEKVIIKQFQLIKNTKFEDISLVEGKNVKVFNITGSLEEFFELYGKKLRLNQEVTQVLFCLDGISNASIDPSYLLKWWNSIMVLIAVNFKAWYFTWLHPDSLIRKFDFYYNVVLQKHHIPLKWLELLVLANNHISSEDKQVNWEQIIFTEFDQKALDELTTTQIDYKRNFMCRFYTDNTKRLIVYQALYITEETLRKMIDAHVIEYIGHKEIDSMLFGPTDDLYNNDSQNFIKSIPYLGFQKEVLEN